MPKDTGDAVTMWDIFGFRQGPGEEPPFQEPAHLCRVPGDWWTSSAADS